MAEDGSLCARAELGEGLHPVLVRGTAGNRRAVAEQGRELDGAANAPGLVGGEVGVWALGRSGGLAWRIPSGHPRNASSGLCRFLVRQETHATVIWCIYQQFLNLLRAVTKEVSVAVE